MIGIRTSLLSREVIPFYAALVALGLATLAVGAMLVNVASGLTGKYLLARSHRRLVANRATLQAQGLSPEALEEQTYWDSLTFGAVKAWRVVHLPITLAFGVLAVAHIVAIRLFWGWT